MTLNVCQANHETHASKVVDTLYGPLRIWDWERYMDFAGYCSAQDEVSKSIDLQQVWERRDTEYFCQILDEQPGKVLDFGSHIGWFSVLALEQACTVLAVDADPENVRLWHENIQLRQPNLASGAWRTKYGALRYAAVTSWMADLSPGLIPNKSVRLMKVDIEGHEHEALNLTRHLWQERKIDYGLWELSPIFEKRDGIMAESYAALVDEIASYGYRWFIWKGQDRWYIEGKDLTFPQENGWCEKI